MFVGASAVGAVLVGSSAAKPFGDPRVRAQQLLNQLVLPPGAQRLHAEPRGDGGLLKEVATNPGDTLLVDRSRIWRVHESYFDVPSFVLNHLPSDAQGDGRGAAGGPGIPYNNEDDEYLFPTSGNIRNFELVLSFVRLLHGWTGIRADAIVSSCPCMHH